jgi:chromosome segregation ATPase
MIINKVVISNFYCFLGEDNVLEFDKGLNIISAPNSGGKSQLFNAFYWTFFDKIYGDNSAGKKEWKDTNRVNVVVCPDKLKVESNLDEIIKSSVEITLTSEYHLNDEPIGELVNYVFTKTVSYKKNISDLIVYSKPSLLISFNRQGETEFIQNHKHDEFLKKIFPESIRKFMWYQGESMDDLYDFSNPSTLKNAIKEISYFPMYDNMEKIVKAAAISIDKKIQKELLAQNKMTNQEQTLIYDINSISKDIEKNEEQIDTAFIEIEQFQDEVADLEHQLKGYDKFRDLKEQLVKLQANLELTKSRIDDSDTYLKETLINKWMLNGCEKLIKASDKKLHILNDEIQNFQKTNNPIPLSLPGPEYVEKMLEDKKCYICERDVEENTAPYEALKKRLNDFENNANYKILQDNYTELNKARRRLIGEFGNIESEISESYKKREDLIKERNRLSKKINSIYTDSGQDDGAHISSAAGTASSMMNKIQSLNSSIERKKAIKNKLENENLVKKDELKELKTARDKIVRTTDINMVEQKAEDYIKMFVKSTGKLRSIAYSKLIKEIQEESNRLYSLYLGGKPQGEIVIDNGVTIIDRKTKSILTELNTAELVAQKLAVANSFLSLSEKKMNRSYPIVADAPTSDFDPENTYNLTLNIGNSFDQMIILSKDYAGLSTNKRNELIKDAKIVKFYEFKNELINSGESDSRTNKKTFITCIK